MNQAPIPTRASCTAPGGRWLARALGLGAAACVAAAMVCTPALAQRHGDHGGDRGGDPRASQDQRAPDPRMDPRPMAQRAPEQSQPRFDPRAFDSREFSDRRQDPAARGQDPHHPSRMTPDERRDLRRQINEAGMDLYQRPPRR